MMDPPRPVFVALHEEVPTLVHHFPVCFLFHFVFDVVSDFQRAK